MPDTEVIELPRPAGSSPPRSPVQDEAPPVQDELVEEELLVEDVSIDGMCGVY
jgi:mycofactocin precursor